MAGWGTIIIHICLLMHIPQRDIQRAYPYISSVLFSLSNCIIWSRLQDPVASPNRNREKRYPRLQTAVLTSNATVQCSIGSVKEISLAIQNPRWEFWNTVRQNNTNCMWTEFYCVPPEDGFCLHQIQICILKKRPSITRLLLTKQLCEFWIW